MDPMTEFDRTPGSEEFTEPGEGGEDTAVSPAPGDPGEDLEMDRAAPGGIARYDPLRAYLAEIGRFTPLSREEEHALARRYHETGDRETAYRLVTSNLKLVVKIAMIYHKVYRNILDLIQEGNLGLLQEIGRAHV
jgi:RNA polymerase sigma-32 factor